MHIFLVSSPLPGAMLPLPQLLGTLWPEVSLWWVYHGELAASGVLPKEEYQILHVDGCFSLPPGSTQGHSNVFANVLLHLPLSLLVCSST